MLTFTGGSCTRAHQLGSAPTSATPVGMPPILKTIADGELVRVKKGLTLRSIALKPSSPASMMKRELTSRSRRHDELGAAVLLEDLEAGLVRDEQLAQAGRLEVLVHRLAVGPPAASRSKMYESRSTFVMSRPGTAIAYPRFAYLIRRDSYVHVGDGDVDAGCDRLRRAGRRAHLDAVIHHVNVEARDDLIGRRVEA